MKINIIEQIGEYNLLLPSLVHKALLAGDRSRYYLNLLIFAIEYAQQPTKEKDSLSDLRAKVGIKTKKFDTVVCESAITSDGIYQIPFYDEIINGLSKSIQDLISPFRPETFYSNPSLLMRAQFLLEAFSTQNHQLILNDERINHLHQDYDGENFYRLICDIESFLVIMQEKMTPEDVYGATAYMVDPEDMFLIRSFMIGLNRTESLRFDHPGLGTLVIRVGNSLLFKNEIGMTDTHILILNITGLTATIRYSDNHFPRVSFFKSLMDPFPVFWGEIVSKNSLNKDDGEMFHISCGTFTARSSEDLLMFISYLSSQIVFLIEWNRAKKALKPFLSGKDVLKVLTKAVKREVGHRAFLILGGEQLIYEALENSSEISLTNGETLSDILGCEHAIDFCISVLEISTQYMRQNPHGALIREDIRAELMRQLMSGREDLHQLYFGYAGHIKVMVSLFTQLTSTLPDDSIINRDAVLDKIHECSVHLDSNLKRIRSNVSNERANSSWLSCFSIISNAMRQLSDAIYLCTIIPVPITNPDIIREISRLSKYAECAAEILYQTIEESDLSSSWNENLQKEHKKYFATISDIIITSDAIVRSAQKRIYAKESLGNEGFMTVEISRLIRDSLQMLLSGSAYIRGQYWHHQLRPDLRFKFKNSQAQAGQVV